MDSATLATTRRSLHGLAELVLAGPQYRAHGTIRLRVGPGGFGTVVGPPLRVDGVHLVTADRRLDIPGRSCAELAAAAGVRPSALRDVYHDVTDVPPDEALAVDPGAAAWLAECWSAGDAALRRLAPQVEPVLWPEHFDVGIRVDDTNFGVSPGDAAIPEPYAYVTPPSPRTGAFWNQPFGAARPVRTLGTANVPPFFTEARALAQLG